MTPETSALFANATVHEFDITRVTASSSSSMCAQAGTTVSLGAVGETGLPLLPPPAGAPGPPELGEEGRRAAGRWGNLGVQTSLGGPSFGSSNRWQFIQLSL